MKKKENEKPKLVAFRANDSLIREIDAAWIKHGGFQTRSQGIRWLIKEGLDAIK